ncbi:leucine aminopeptidase, putative [Theileria equi strain WA]|uniref:leucyl aminopeptidase n=1 Tax=Theileria equi strain WA TaxID=1537102 RepID=L0B1G7_THEEQ|nr:leucine aminopeptidase, putative [Theileria equi strain WA]AFZ81343.1 leucine aminopeptidase, putative [Theileria equi strain WA]|eukprot:XP_004831009.1 leucine aminopeptidase, putative [Theileria equi strain WA]
MASDFPTTQSPEGLVNVAFQNVAAFDWTALHLSPSNNAVIHLSFSSEVESKGDEYDLKSLGYFPSAHIPVDSPLLLLARTHKFSAGLGDKLEHITVNSSGTFTLDLVLGCGKNSEFLLSDLYTLTKGVAEVLTKYKISKAAFVLEHMESEFIEGLLTGTFVNLSVDNRFKKDAKHEYYLKDVLVFHSDKDVEHTEERSKVFSSAMHLTRELVTAPPNYANTVSISTFIKKHFEELGLEVKVLEKDECEKLGMGAYLAVSQGSKYPPKFIHATYKGEGPIKKKIALVGKGIMFDAGGYNMKSAASEIHLMKFDMGGMATVFGAAKAIAGLGPKGLEVHFVSATCENMVDANSYRPGDIITASDGKTIEVTNTDAEGRLTLADALCYAGKLDVDVILDIATLTGAQIIALGYNYSAFFASSDELAEVFAKSVKLSGELSWRMPLAKEYRDSLKSKVADLANHSPEVKAGTIGAALFLQEFVKKPWVHVDIAGPAFDKSTGRGTGYFVRTLTNFVLELARTS